MMKNWMKRAGVRNRASQSAAATRRRRPLTIESLENRRVLAAILSGEELTDSLAVGESETFDFSLASPGSIRVGVGQTAGATGVPRVSIVDSDGNILAGPSTGTDDVTLQLTGQPAGDYQAIVTETNQDEPLDYRIRVLTLPSTPTTISGRDSSSLGNGERATSSLDVGGFNIHRFTLTQPSRFRIAVGQDAGATGDPRVTIFGPNGSIVAPAATGTDDVLVQLINQPAGTYTVVVDDVENDEAMDYYLRLIVLTDDAIAGPINPIAGRDSGDLANGSEIVSSIEVGSFNFHRFTIPAGGDASLFVGQDAGSVGQPTITIFDSAGNIADAIDTGDDDALGRLVGFSAGSYTAIVEDENNNEAMTYRLRLLSLPGTPAAITGRDSAEMVSGETVTSSLPIGSANFHQFVMPSSGTFRVAVGQVAGSPGNPQLTIFRPDGTALGNLATGTDDATLQFVNQPAGRYTAVVAEAGGDAALDYQLRLLALPGTPTPIDGRDSIPLPNGEQIDATLPLGSFNVHTVEVGAVGTLLLSLGQDAGAAGRPELTIFTADGTVVPIAGNNVTTGDDDITTRLTGLAAGTYTVVVSEVDGDEAMDYHLRALTFTGTPTAIAGRDSSSLNNGAEFASTLGVGEFNFHRFVVGSNAAVRIALTQAPGAIGSPELTIYDSTGALIAGPTSGDDGITLTQADVDAGTYTAVVTDADNDSPMAYQIRLLTLPGTPTPIDGRDSASLASGAEVTSRIEAGSFNFHSFTVASLGRARLFLGQDADQPGRPEITVLDSLGNVVRDSANGDDEVNVSLDNLNAGTYTAIVSEATGTAAMNYRLRMLSLPGTPETLPAREPDLNGSIPVSGNVPVGSFALFPFKATGGDDVTVQVIEESTTPDSEPQFEVLDSGGNTLLSQNGIAAATGTFQAPRNGKYYVFVTDGNADEALDFNITLTGNRLPPPIATISPASQTADESDGAVTFDVNLDCPWETDITIPIMLTGTATDGVDYTISRASAIIPAGSLSTTITVSLIDDFADEPETETIIATLGDATLIELGSAITHTITINDNDDPPPLATITSPSQTAEEDVGSVTFEIVLSEPAPGEVNIPFTLTGSATQNEDYTIQNSPITIAEGQSSVTVFINLLDDTADEPDQETIIVTLANPDRAALGLATVHTVTINDNDLPPPTVSFNLASQDGDEDSGTQTVDVVLSRVASEPVSVPLVLSGTATQDSDYTITGSPIIIPAGSTSASVSITILDDTIDEANQETVVVTLGEPSGATLGDVTVHTLSINDNDRPALTASVGTATQTVTESVGTLTFDIDLSAVADQEVRVPFAISGTAVSGEDFTLTDASPAIIAAGAQSATVSFSILNDAVIEDSETLIVTLGTPTGATLGTTIVHTATITDNDVELPTVNFAPPSLSFLEGAGTVSFEVTLSAPLATAILIPFSVSGTAESTDVGGTDYSIPSSPLLLPAGETMQRFFVIINDDPTEEPDETVIVTLEPSTDYRLGSTTVHTMTIRDNDSPVIADPTINVATSTQTVDEDAGSVTFEILLSAAASVPVSVPVTLSGTATRDDDYTITTTSATIPVGSTSATVVLNIIDDTVEESAQETIIATLATPTGAVLGASPVHTVLINDNDSPAPTVSVNAASQTADEDSGSASFDVLLSAPLSQDVSVPVTLSGTATNGTDYTIEAGPVVIPAGSTSVPFTITIINDTIDERTNAPAGQPDGETVIVTLGQPTATGLDVNLGSQTVHTLTINDDDAPPLTVSLSSFEITIPEDVGTYQFDVVLSETSATDVTVPFTVSGTATNGNDYTFTASPVVIPPGQTSTTLIVTVLDDDDVEASTETVVIALGTPTGATLSGNTIHTGTIFDNESNLAVVNITPATRTVDEDAGTVSFDVTLSSPLDQPVTVPFTLSGTATDASDYTFTASPLTIPAGLTTINAVITVLDDPDDEADQETLVVTLGTPTGADLGASIVHTLTINDNDDPLPTLQVISSEQTANEGTGFVTFDIALSSPTNRAVTIPFSVSGTATQTADFTITASPLTIAAGDTSARVTVSILDDQADEMSDETVVVTLGMPTGATLGANSVHTVTIIDNDDPPPVVTIAPSAQTVGEDAGTRSFEIVLSAASSQPITVPFSLSGTATLGSDVTFTASPLTIPAGMTRITANMVVIDDGVEEADTETFIVTLSSPSGATLGTDITHTLTINDNDDPVVVLPTVSVSTATQTFAEGQGTLGVDVRLSSLSTTPVTVPIVVSGIATAGTDYATPVTSVTIPAGVLSATFNVDVIDDAIDEPSETIIVELGTPTGATLSTVNRHTATIIDNDDPAIIANVTNAAQTVGEDAGFVTFNVTLSSPATQDVLLPVTIGGTATRGVDYSAPSDNLAFSAGTTIASFSINILEDTIDEPSETILVTLGETSDVQLGASTMHTVSITDNDDPVVVLPVVSVVTSAQSFEEDLGTLSFEVTLSSASDRDVVVPLVLSGTAVAGVDYQTPVSSIAFPAGSTSATVNISVIDDTADEASETIVVSLGTPDNATLGAQTSHTATVIDNDEPVVALPIVSVVTSAQSFDENLGTLSFDVTLSSASDLPIVVPLVLSGTALAGVDYQIPPLNVTFPAGSTLATVNINVLDDTVDEAAETIIVTLDAPSAETPGGATLGGATLGTQIRHTATIIDDDEPPVVVPPTFTTTDPGSVTAGAGPQTQAGFATYDPGSGVDPLPTLIGYVVSDVSNPALFAATPAVDNSGTLTFTPATGQSGTSTFSVVAQSTGGVGGTPVTSVAQSFNITVEPEVTNPINVVTVSTSIPAGASDAGIEGRSPPPTSWARQRSSMRVAQFDFQLSLARPLTAADLTLTNLGIGGLGGDMLGTGPNAGTVITLRDDQITTAADLQSLELSFDSGQLADGVYQMVIGSSATGGDPITINGTRENGFFVLTGDYNGSGVVDNRDFTTFAYWFLNESPPEYVDLRSPVGINAQDFVVFLDHFGQNMFPERTVNSASAIAAPFVQDNRDDDDDDWFIDEALADPSFIAELF